MEDNGHSNSCGARVARVLRELHPAEVWISAGNGAKTLGTICGKANRLAMKLRGKSFVGAPEAPPIHAFSLLFCTDTFFFFLFDRCWGFL